MHQYSAGGGRTPRMAEERATAEVPSAAAQAALDADVNSAAAVIQGWMECYSADMGGTPVDAGWFSLPADFLF